MAGNNYLTQDRTNVRQIEKKSVTASTDTPTSGDLVAVSTGGKVDNTLLNATNSSAGVGDAAKLAVLDGTGRLDLTMMPVGVVPETATITTSEALSAGDWVNVWTSTGAKVRKADATTAGKEAHGFVLASFASGASAIVYFEGTNTAATGLAAGPVFLSTTSGTATAAAPTGSGNVQQRIGISTGSGVNFEQGVAVVLA